MSFPWLPISVSAGKTAAALLLSLVNVAAFV
jgi:hypothetical protein